MGTETTTSDESATKAFGESVLALGAEHEEVRAVWRPRSGLRAIIAIHSTALGPSLGGTRFHAYTSLHEALTDVLRLSKAMSYKAAVAGLDLGGGKAVIIGDPAEVRTDDLMIDYARFVDTFGGRYLTAEDVGTSQADMDLIGQLTPFVGGRSAALGGSGDPSPITAFGVVRAIEATAAALWGSPNLEGRHIAINGVGKVGHELAALCAQRGAWLSVADVSPAALAAVRSELTAEVVAPEAIHAVPCDLYAPCALGSALNDRTVAELACQAVCGAANNQLDTAHTEKDLQSRGITYVPDYVANAGGIINIAYEAGGYDAAAARAHAGRIYDTVTRLFEEAGRSGEALSVIADRMAEARMAAATAAGGRA
ncbi:MAG: Glu/Leu/Phe/Val dehydrogenase dimerization domain-containing protein [Acidimicrobiales bacterium]